MIIVRPIRDEDLDNLMRLAKAAYPGMTTLPPDRDALLKKIEKSTTSIAKQVTEPGRENYLLVMEDTATNLLVGTAGIIPSWVKMISFTPIKLTRLPIAVKR